MISGLVVLLCGLVFLGAGLPQESRAQSGETQDAAGIFQAQCQDLRGTTGVDADVIFTCEADRNACKLDSESIDQIGVGFCDDRFPEAVRVIGPGEPLKSNVTILATSFGADTGIRKAGIAADILCETFVENGEGVRACRKIIEDPLGCPVSGCPVCNDRQGEALPAQEFIVTSSDSCDDVEEQLADAVTGVPPALAFALLIDLDQLAEPGSEALLVCPGFRWECVDESADTFEGDAIVEYQVQKAVVSEDPDCIKIGGRRIC